jgi:hypothetical protein
MTEPAAGGGIDNPDVALRRLVDSLAQRFPDIVRTEIEQRVRSIYDGLKEQATVDSHLVAMTEGRVTNELRQRGETIHSRGEDVE